MQRLCVCVGGGGEGNLLTCHKHKSEHERFGLNNRWKPRLMYLRVGTGFGYGVGHFPTCS